MVSSTQPEARLCGSLCSLLACQPLRCRPLSLVLRPVRRTPEPGRRWLRLLRSMLWQLPLQGLLHNVWWSIWSRVRRASTRAQRQLLPPWLLLLLLL